MPTLRHALATAAITLGAALAAPAVAAADSLVFIKDDNVWLAHADGGGQYQVTTDGTHDQPYRSPTQADDGTIVVAHHSEIVRMRQNGSVLNAMDPPPLRNSVGALVDGAPVDVAVSPDGSKIVYSLVGYSCPIGVPGCGARPVTAVTPADHLAPVGNAYTSQSSWVTNDRALTFAGYGHQVNTLDVGQEQDVHWFDDEDLAGQGNSTDLSDGEVSRQGTWVAAIRGYGADKTVLWLRTRGDVAHGSRAAGTLDVPDLQSGCVTSTVADLSGPTWSPDGRALAWREDGQIQVWANVEDCTLGSRPIIAGGSEPDWGPADVNPGPRAGTPVPPAPIPPAPPAPPAKTGKPKPKAKPALELAQRRTLRAALRRGLPLTLTGVPRGTTVRATAKSGRRTVASGSAKVGAAGTAKVTLRFTKAARRSLSRKRTVKLTITGGGATATLTLRR